MNANSAMDQSWPKTAAGTVDWEFVFENPETGLLALVGQAASPAALRECAIFIIAKLYSRKDDPEEVASFTKEITALIPDDLATDNLSDIIAVVVIMLRRIKEYRTQKATDHEDMLAAAEKDGAKDAPGKGGRTKRSTDRSKQDPLAAGPLPSERAKKPDRNMFFAALIGGLAAAGVTLFVVLKILEPPPEETRADILIRQIQAAPAGKGPKTHIFGGVLRAGKNAGKMTVTADDVPIEVCFEVAWGLVNRGRVIVNDLYSRKLSPEIVRSLCTKKGGLASLTFLPKK